MRNPVLHFARSSAERWLRTLAVEDAHANQERSETGEHSQAKPNQRGSRTEGADPPYGKGHEEDRDDQNWYRRVQCVERRAVTIFHISVVDEHEEADHEPKRR